MMKVKLAAFLVASILLLSIVFFSQSMPQVNAQTTYTRTPIYQFDPQGPYPVGLAIDAAGDYIVTEINPSGPGGFLSKISGGTRTQIYQFSSTVAPYEVAFDLEGNYIVCEFLTPANYAYLSKIDKLSGVREEIYKFPWYFSCLTVATDSAGNFIVTIVPMAWTEDYLSRITPQGVRTHIARIDSDKRGYYGLAIDGKGNFIYTESGQVTGGDGRLTKVTANGLSKTVIYQFPLGTMPMGVAIDSAGNYIVAEASANVLSKITPAGERSVIYTFAPGTSPNHVKVDAAGNYIVTEDGARTLSKISLLPKIAFASDRDGNYEIYVMNADGSGQTRLTNNPASDSMPNWSPDGSKITFLSNRDGNYEIYVMNADGTDQTNLSNNDAFDSMPDWSPDGSKITFASYRDGNWEIYVMNADGTGQTRLTTNAADDQYPDWSPDGSKIAFSRWVDGNWEIYVMNADGTVQTRLTTNTGHDFYPDWSPDGSKIAFHSNRDGNYEIYVMNADGTDQTRLTTNTAIDQSPDWSPDGSKIAFNSNRDGNDEIYVMNADGTGQTRLTTNTASDLYPDFAPAEGAIDNTPPTTSDDAPSAWQKADFTVTLACTDNPEESGCKETKYNVDASGWQTGTSISVSTEGDHLIEYYSIDNADNQESIKSTYAKLDKTAPTITGAAMTSPNVNGWYNADVVVHFEASDILSGIDTVTPDATISTEGSGQSVTGTAVDKAGNSASVAVGDINLDKTAPTITGSRTPAPNDAGWNNVDVVVTFECSDSLSGLADDACPVPTTLTTEGAGQSVTGTVTDEAGNSASVTVSGINIDKTPPTITIDSPQEGTVCLGCGTGTLTISFSVTDSLSGEGPVTAKIDGTVEVHNGDSIPLASLSPGQHTLTVEAKDAAGNTAQKSVSFQVTVTSGQLTELVEQYYQEGLIDNKGIENSLIKKLGNAQAALSRGQPNVAKNMLGAFINEVQAQSGKHIDATAASTLINCARVLMSTL